MLFSRRGDIAVISLALMLLCFDQNLIGTCWWVTARAAKAMSTADVAVMIAMRRILDGPVRPA